MAVSDPVSMVIATVSGLTLHARGTFLDSYTRRR
jgi:hypothetical protein